MKINIFKVLAIISSVSGSGVFADGRLTLNEAIELARDVAGSLGADFDQLEVNLGGQEISVTQILQFANSLAELFGLDFDSIGIDFADPKAIEAAGA